MNPIEVGIQVLRWFNLKGSRRRSPGQRRGLKGVYGKGSGRVPRTSGKRKTTVTTNGLFAVPHPRNPNGPDFRRPSEGLA